jgi:propionyl-CoA carboxylase beta chain
MLRRFMNFLPANNREKPPVTPTNDPADRMDYSLDTLVPDNANKPYDMKELMVKVVDDNDFFETAARLRQEHHHRLWPHGWSSGRYRRQPAAGAGRLSGHQVLDQGRPLRPLLRCLQHSGGHLRRCPGLHAGHAQEYGGIIKHGAKLLYAYAECTVPKVTVITRKAYGGAYDVMSSKHLRGDVNLAWPSAEIAVMGPKGAVEIIFREEKNDPAKLAEREAEYKAKFANPFVAGARGFIDDVIMPHATRKRICRSLAMLRDKKLDNPWRKHGNIPL